MVLPVKEEMIFTGRFRRSAESISKRKKVKKAFWGPALLLLSALLRRTLVLDLLFSAHK